MPKYYTIASSSDRYPTKIKIAISLTIDELKDGQKKYGQNSQYLKNMYENGQYASCNVFVKDSMFYLPTATPQPPLIMIGPGTGVVPFIGFIQGFQSKQRYSNSATLYFGCRHSQKDFIYKEFLTEAQKDGYLTTLRVAFSREGDKGQYVQDLIKEDKESILKQIEQQAIICICGNTKMGQEV